jgi:hypothetical protein
MLANLIDKLFGRMRDQKKASIYPTLRFERCEDRCTLSGVKSDIVFRYDEWESGVDMVRKNHLQGVLTLQNSFAASKLWATCGRFQPPGRPTTGLNPR